MNNIYDVRPVSAPIDCKVEVPGSKSITNRALLLASMARGKSLLENVLFCDDSRGFIECLQTLGYDMEVSESEKRVSVYGGCPIEKAGVNVRSAGTTARFLTAMLAAYDGEYTIESSEQMKSRPMKPLTDVLVNLGCSIEFIENEGYLPFKLRGRRLAGGEISIDSGLSSQFTSALLMTGCLHKNDLIIKTIGKEISKPYIDITLKMMQQFGVNAVDYGHGIYTVASGQEYISRSYKIEPDVSGACYFYAAAAITGGSVLVRDVHFSSMQGDIEFIRILERMGCTLGETDDGILLKGPATGVYSGLDVDMNACSDQVMTLAALAPFASSPVTIRNIGHIKYQESNRINAVIAELSKMGIKCEEIIDGIRIYPGIPSPSLVETYNDHRIAMAFSLIGLRIKGIRISNPSCVSKTFENYFEVFGGLGTKEN